MYIKITESGPDCVKYYDDKLITIFGGGEKLFLMTEFSCMLIDAYGFMCKKVEERKQKKNNYSLYIEWLQQIKMQFFQSNCKTLLVYYFF